MGPSAPCFFGWPLIYWGMTKYNVAPEDQEDHEMGLLLAEALGLKPKRDTGYYQTGWGTKTAVGLTRTIKAVIDKAEGKW
jgi:hypothetical protein